MEIIFDHVVPAFLAGTPVLGTGLWGAEVRIPAGAKVLISAQSGKGKTTLLSYLFGIRSGYKGQIRLGAEDVSGIGTDRWSELRRTEMSMVFQDLRLFDNLTVRENLEVRSKLSSTMTTSEMTGALDRLGVREYMDRSCATLSMGQKQRVAIVRSLIQPFRWLLMDEPFSHLDAVNTGLAMELITEVCARHKAGYLISSLGGEDLGIFDQVLEL